MTHAADLEPTEDSLDEPTEETETEPATRRVGPITTATTAAASGVLIVAWALEQWAGVTVPLEVQGAAAVVIVFLTGWLMPPAK